VAVLVQLKEGLAGIRLHIDKEKFSIGRGPENDISIDDGLVSKVHAVIEIMENKEKPGFDYFLQDQASTNGLYVNDEKIQRHKLSHGDIIRLGLSNFQFQDDVKNNMDETAQLQKTWIPGVFYTKKKSKS